MNRNRVSLLTLVLLTLLLSAWTIAGAQVLTAPCLNASVPLVVEEARLPYTLPNNPPATGLQSESWAQQMIEGAGWQNFGPAVVDRLCNTRDLDDAQDLVLRKGTELWRMAVARAQQIGPVTGSAYYSDDRPLYWTRMQVRAAIRQWVPGFPITTIAHNALINTFDRASRGMFDIHFPEGRHVKRLIFSGFDPYTLDGGTLGNGCTAFAPPACIGNNIRHGNPSGATVLALTHTHYVGTDGIPVYIEAYTLPVNFPEFEQGFLEDTVGPHMKPGPARVNASVTVSQAGPYTFNVEQWNGRYHGTSLGNDNVRPCQSLATNPSPPPTLLPQLAVNNYECNSQVVLKWGGPSAFDLWNPPQWTTTSLPIAAMIAANTGVGITPPPGDGWTGDANAFGVIWHTPFTEFPSCSSTTELSVNGLSCENFTCPTPLIAGQLPPPGLPPTGWPQTPPDANSCSQSGGGGNYLSNESAYRNTNLRDRMGLGCPGEDCIPAGHIHTPNMNVFATTDVFNTDDTTFNAWRLAIIAQARNLIHVVGSNAPKSKW